MRRRAVILAIVPLAAIAVALPIAVPFVRIRLYDAAYADIARGEVEAAAIAAMGTPDRTEAGARDAFWDDVWLQDDTVARVVRRHVYIVRGVGLPILWTIDIDAAGHVISKHRWD